MRPKKTILLVDADERRASLRRFVLEQRRYAVFHRTSLEEVERDLHYAVNLYGVDLVMLSDTVPLGGAILGFAAQMNPETRSILLQDRAKPRDEEVLADAVTAWDCGHAADVLSMVRILMARKRGPKNPLQRRLTPMQAQLATRRAA